MVRIRGALAEVLIGERRLAEAEAEYKGLLELTLSAGDVTGCAVVLDSLAKIALTTFDFDDVQAYSQKALELARSKGEAGLEARALLNLAQLERARARTSDDALEVQSHLSQGLKLAEQAAALMKPIETGSAEEYGNALSELASQYYEQGKLENALSTLDQALAAYDEDQGVDHEKERARVLLSKAEILYDNKRFTDCLQAFDIANSSAQKGKQQDLLLKGLIGKGVAEADLGHFDEATTIHERAASLARAAGLDNLELSAIQELGTDSLLRGYPEPALYKFLDAQRRLVAQGGVENKQTAHMMMAIGRCYRELGQTDAAIHYYLDALRLFCQDRDTSSRALALNSIAVAYLDAGDQANFTRYYEQARQLYNSLNDRAAEATLLYNFAQSKLVQGKPAEAMPVYEEALRKMASVGDVNGQGRVLRGLGLAAILAKDWTGAIDYYQRALKLSEASSSIEADWDSNLGLGKAYRALKQNEQALDCLQKAVALVEKERSQLSRDSFKTHNLDFRSDCYVELVGLLGDLNRPYEALEVAEKGKARAFLDLLANRKTRRIDLGAALPSLPGEAKSPSAAPLQVAMASGEAGFRSVTVNPKASAAVEATAISPVNAQPPSQDEIKNIVARRGSICVEYYLLPNKVLIWVVNPDGTIHMTSSVPVSPSALRKTIAACLLEITTQPKTQAEVKLQAFRRQADLRNLYKLLIEPVQAYLPKGKDAPLTIVPSGPIFSVPFAALIAPDGAFLMENYVLSYTPALGVLRATQKLQAEVSSAGHSLLAFGNPITKQIAFLGALPYAEKEVKDVAKLFGPEKSIVKIGAEANKAAFDDLAPKAADIHLATHGLIDEEHPIQSALVLAPTAVDDGLLTVKDILALKELKAKLIVLSACQTGRGKITGDGVVGLSRAFIIAGTPSVLVSQWNVDDVMTAFQMSHFYKAYLSGQDKAKSLRNAQLSTVRFMENSPPGTKPQSDPNYVRANPRYWAAFQLIGESN